LSRAGLIENGGCDAEVESSVHSLGVASNTVVVGALLLLLMLEIAAILG